MKIKYTFKNIEITFGRKFHCHDHYFMNTDFVRTIYTSIIYLALF